MERVNNELKVALEKNDSVAASNADAKFHGIFLERSHNVHLIKIIEDLKIKYRRIEVNFFKGLLIAKSSIEEHKALIAALRAGAIVLAEKILHSNWEKGLERLRRNEENRDNVLEIAK